MALRISHRVCSALTLTLTLTRTRTLPQVLFKAFEVPDDDLKVVVMECLLEVPVSNLQAEEIWEI